MISMKKLLLFSAIAIFTINIFAQGHDISITVAGLENEQVIVGYHLGKQRLVLDTIHSTQTGKLKIEGANPLPIGVYFLYANTFYFEFLVAEQEFVMSLDKEAAYSSLIVSGSRENELFASFQNQMGVLQRQQRTLADSLSKVSGDDSLQIRKEYAELVNAMSNARTSLVRTHHGTFFADFLNLMVGVEVPIMEDISDESERKIAQYEYYRDHYFDLIPAPERLMRTPVIHEYVMKYFTDLVIPQPDTIAKAIDKFLLKTDPGSETFRYWLVTLFNHYQESNIMGMDAVTVHLAEKYYLSGMANWVTDESKTEIQKELRFIKPNLIGSPAPDMILVDTSLQRFFVSKIPDDYLILFFYDPDCGVCRKKTPILKDAYPELKSEGAEVLAICTISDIEKWRSYIEKNEMNWYNAGDPQGKSLFRVDYNVRSTPQFYILDKQRKIVAKKLDANQLLGFIKDHKFLQNQ